MCMAAHPFFLATKGNESDREVDWDISEANRQEIRGCCSEALVCVQGVILRNLWAQLEQETRNQHPELKVQCVKTPDQRRKGKGSS